MSIILQTINNLCEQKLITSIPFIVTDDLRFKYVEEYAKLKGSANFSRKSNLVYALKLAGLNLQKYSGTSTSGFVYCIANPAFPKHVKVGITKDINKRLQNYQTYDPYRAYYILCYRFVENKKETEKKLLNKYKLNLDKGEWVSDLTVVNFVKSLM